VEEALARARALLGERKEGTKHGVKVREGGVPTEEVIAKREARKQELEKKGLPAFRRSVKAREELAKAEVPVPKDEQVVSNIRKWLTANPQNPYTKEIESAVNDAVRKGLTQEEINKLIELMEGRVGVKLLTGVVKAQRSVRDIIARRNTLLREMMSAKLGRSVSADEVGDAMGVSKGGDKGTVVSGESTSIGRTADPSGGGMSVAGEPVAFKLNGDVKGMLYVETQPSTGQEWIMFKAEGEEKYSRKTAKDIELLEGMINTIKAQYGAEALPTVRNAIGRKITQGKYEKRVASGEQPPRPSRAGGRAKGKGKAKAETVAEVVGGK
jgi:hypothetical protein